METIEQESVLPLEIWCCIFDCLPVLLRFRIVSVRKEWYDTMHRTVKLLKSHETARLDDTTLGRMVNMVSLNISGIPYFRESITGKGFKTHWKLASLSLCCAFKIQDSDISCLNSLTSLKLVDMSHITDQAIKGLTSLQALHLGCYVPGITDDGIQHLTGLTTLCALDKYHKITEKSINKLTALKTLYLLSERIRELPLIKTNAHVIRMGTFFQ